MLNALLLAGACAAAYLRPVWGFGLLLLLTSTLFNLSQYFTVPLPVGYIEPTEALLAAILLATWRRVGRSALQSERGNRARKVGVILAPYLLWQTFCVVLGLVIRPGTEQLRFGLRFWLASLVPWLSLYALAKLSIDEGHKVFKTAFYLGLATACVHLALQLTDYRPAMRAAYWFVPENGEQDTSWIQTWLDHSDFVRGLPQGIILILFCSVLAVAMYIFGDAQGWKKIRNLGVAAIFFTALFITLTRSLIAVFVAGLAALMVLALLRIRFNAGSILRAVSVLSLFAGAAFLYDTIRPGFLDLWSTRVALLTGRDSDIFSEQNAARGKDNLSAIAAIQDHPIFGLGNSRYPHEYSLRSGPPSDTHPMLVVGLVGGYPAMILILLLEVSLFLPDLRGAWRSAAIDEVLPFAAILIMNAFALNMIGAGGSLMGAPILCVCIFANEMANRRALAAGIRPMYVLRKGVTRDTASPHLHPHAVV